MKVIGQHMQSTGLLEIWTDSGLLGQKTAENALMGKGHEKAIHKITAQAFVASSSSTITWSHSEQRSNPIEGNWRGKVQADHVIEILQVSSLHRDSVIFVTELILVLVLWCNFSSVSVFVFGLILVFVFVLVLKEF